MPCKIKKGHIITCKGLDAVLEMDGGSGTRRQGAKLQTLMNMRTGKFSRNWIVLKGGKHHKTGVVMNFCPFCGASILEDKKSLTTAKRGEP